MSAQYQSSQKDAHVRQQEQAARVLRRICLIANPALRFLPSLKRESPASAMLKSALFMVQVPGADFQYVITM